MPRLNEQLLLDSSPKLFSFALNKQISVKRAFEQDELSSLFQLPLSQTAFLQLQNVQQIMESIVLRICSGYPTSKEWHATLGEDMATSLCIIFFIFFHSFFVS